MLQAVSDAVQSIPGVNHVKPLADLACKVGSAVNNFFWQGVDLVSPHVSWAGRNVQEMYFNTTSYFGLNSTYIFYIGLGVAFAIFAFCAIRAMRGGGADTPRGVGADRDPREAELARAAAAAAAARSD